MSPSHRKIWSCVSPPPLTCKPRSWGWGGGGAWLTSGRSTGPGRCPRGWGPVPPTGLSPTPGRSAGFAGNRKSQPSGSAPSGSSGAHCLGGLRGGLGQTHWAWLAWLGLGQVPLLASSAPGTQLSVDACLEGCYCLLGSASTPPPPPGGAGRNCRPELCRRPWKAPRDRRRQSAGCATRDKHLSSLLMPRCSECRA